jgi:hypothetical protein
MSTVLITNPAHDEATTVLSAWIQSVADYIEGSKTCSHDIIGLSNSDVTKQKFNDAFDKHSPNLVMVNGHGNSDVLCGHDNHPIIELNDPENVRYKDLIIHALACAAAKSLGVDLVANGLSAFIGYNENFHFYHNVKPGEDPLKDPLSALFLEPAYQIPKSLAEGRNAQEAFDEAQAMYKANFIAAHKGNVDQPILASLFHNIKNHVILGNPTSTI